MIILRAVETSYPLLNPIQSKTLTLSPFKCFKCCSALCLSSILVYWSPPFPPLPEINGRCEQNRTVSRENAPQENICQSFRAESNRRPILRCRPLPTPFKLAKLLDPNKTLEPFCQTASYFHALGQNQFGRADHCQLPLSTLGPAAFSGG